MAFNVNPSNFRTLEELANPALCNDNTDQIRTETKFGQNTDIDNGTTEDVWAYGGTRAYPGAAETFNIASSSVNDVNTTGSGAWQVTIYGLDANYDLQSETVNLNGTSNVATANTYINIHRMIVIASGSSNTATNDGAITATGATSSNVMASISAGDCQTQMTHYMIPRNFTAFFLGGMTASYRSPGTAGGEREAEITLKVKPFNQPPRNTLVVATRSNTFNREFKVPVKLPEKTLVWVTADAATNNTAVSVELSFLMINNDNL